MILTNHNKSHVPIKTACNQEIIILRHFHIASEPLQTTVLGGFTPRKTWSNALKKVMDRAMQTAPRPALADGRNPCQFIGCRDHWSRLLDLRFIMWTDNFLHWYNVPISVSVSVLCERKAEWYIYVLQKRITQIV